jgi:hypothetical protein
VVSDEERIPQDGLPVPVRDRGEQIGCRVALKHLAARKAWMADPVSFSR